MAELLPRIVAVVLLLALVAATNTVRRTCDGEEASWHLALPFASSAPAGCEQHTWLRVAGGDLGIQASVDG